MSSQTPRERHGELVQQRNDLVTQRERLKAERSKALINGKEFSKKQQMVEIDHDLEALEAAIAILDEQATRQEERDYASQQADNLQRKIDEINSGEALHLEKIALVGDHLRVAHELLASIHSASISLKNNIASATGAGHVSSLDAQNIATRISERIGILLSRLSVTGNYGIFQWLGVADRQLEWVKEERQALAGDIQVAIERLSKRIDDLRRQASAE